MAVLWKAWKAKSRLPPLSTSPLGIPPTAGGIPTFPQCRRQRRMEKWKTQTRFSTFPPPRFPLSNRISSTAGAASPLRFAAPPQGVVPTDIPTKGDSPQQLRPAPTAFLLQAHRLLESTCPFRLISLWNQFLISGSFLDWKMLRPTNRAAPGTKYRMPESDLKCCDVR